MSSRWQSGTLSEIDNTRLHSNESRNYTLTNARNREPGTPQAKHAGRISLNIHSLLREFDWLWQTSASIVTEHHPATVIRAFSQYRDH